MISKKFNNIIMIILLSLFVFLIIVEPDICSKGAYNGILLSGRVIIPSLFPFTTAVLYIIKSNVFSHFKFASPFTKHIFHINPDMFFIMLLSMIGGYPIGAKLLNQAITDKRISSKNAGIMLNYCVNAGPAFIILAIGNGILGSKKTGYILLFSHLISSLLIAFFCGFFFDKENIETNYNQKSLRPSDNFVLSVAESSSTVLIICSYVILFSTITSYIVFLSEKIKYIKYTLYFFEITNAVSMTDNIFFISFLLGFAGISIWCQVISVGKNIKINYKLFILSRISHGLLSALITYMIFKIFKITVSTFTNNIICDYKVTYSNITLSISLLIMVILLVITIYSKRYSGKFYHNLV